jgi:acetyl esterase/lipase
MRFLLTILISFSLIMPSEGQVTQGKILNIWDSTKVKASRVTLTPYYPKNGGNGVAVIICPGGSYFWLSKEIEGKLVAEWLSENGITAFVLRYRVPGAWSFITFDRAIVPHSQYPDMIMDLQRAIQHVRENSQQYKIDPNKLGVMGFSAGGHLVMLSGVLHNTDFLKRAGIDNKTSLRPDFIVPMYPVVTLSHPQYTHKRSRRGLLGEWRKYKKEMRDSLSLEKRIPDDCPPVFLVNCKDDPTVKYQNSILLDSALTAKGIEHKYILYNTGGHGFGASEDKTTEEAIQWREEFLEWLNDVIL